ncbi:hypothetical protein C5Y96_24315 [Blastopirellula marina]|uniref:DUF7133 domain-containing protein n=1 Tax=Blastopirellula marina TaxID=124 RepID=A0A2S8EZX6_9BACT|nr:MULTISPECIES: hypothetical protein [Pirellulaceae]PQO25469.1 hypothetical protein C5Y96_24315 [Blastopirellula marina]RCS42433.1 hypothetical protein DTL36_24365 [Bremerella cremea]
MFRYSFTFLIILCSTVMASAQDNEQEKYYKITPLPIPDDVVLEVGAMEMMPDGKLAVSTRRGEIYMVSNPKASSPETDTTFKRYAHGLHEVLGLAYRNGWLYVTQRCDVSRIRDTDGDGEADEFEVVSDGWGVSGDYHEYAFGSRFDEEGNIWVTLCLTGSFSSQVPFRGWCLRVNEDGTTTPTVSGVRSPGGIGKNAAGDIFYTDNQGPWNGTSGLKHLVPGHFVGHPGGNDWYKLAPNMGPRPQDPESNSRFHIEAKKIPEYMPAAVLFPYDKMGKSASGIDYDRSEGKFGPFAGQMLVGDQSHSTVMRVVLEKVNGRYQGACIPFLQGIGSGTLPLWMTSDGNLFVGGTNRGWGSRGNKPFSLERINWTGTTPFDLLDVKANPDGFTVTFTKPIDPESAKKTDAIYIDTYTYIYQSSYGSPEVEHAKPAIKNVEVAADNMSVKITLDELKEGHIHEIHFPGIREKSGDSLWHDVLYYTLNQIPGE